MLVTDSSNDTVWAASWLRRYLISKAEQQITATPPLSDVIDRLTLDELPEPEFVIERQLCSVSDLGKSDVCSDPLFAPPVTSRANAPGVACRVTVATAWASQALAAFASVKSTPTAEPALSVPIRTMKQTNKQPSARPTARCVRAPLIAEGTPWNVGGTWRAMTSKDAAEVKSACFPDQVRYEVHGGDSMVIRGDRTPFATLVRRGSDGVCRRPQPGDGTFAASRTLQPRISLGPHASVADGDPRRCPSVQQGTYRAPNPGFRGCRGRTELPKLMEKRWHCRPTYGQGDFPLHLVRGQDFYPQPPDLKTERQDRCLAIHAAVGRGPELREKPDGPALCIRHQTGRRRPWLNREFELFSMLPLDGKLNQCILTSPTEEVYPTNGAEQVGCSGFCRFRRPHRNPRRSSYPLRKCAR